MLKIDTELFIDIITAERVELDFEDVVNERRINTYIGPSKEPTQICVSDEYLSNRTAKAIMRQLGIDDLIISLFPSDDIEVQP